MPSLIQLLSGLSREARKVVLVATDGLLLLAAFWASLALRHNTLWPESTETYFSVAVLVVVVVLVSLAASQLYNAVVRHAGVGLVVRVAAGLFVGVGFSYLIVTGTAFSDPPRSSWIIFWGVGVGLLGSYRLVFRELFRATNRSKGAKRVMVYGAGEAGKQLADALRLDDVHHIVAFVDDDENLQGCWVQDLRVNDPDDLDSLVADHSVDAILLAMPSVPRSRRAEIIKSLERLPVEVLVIPGLSDLATGRCSVTNIRKVDIGDILGRDVVEPVEGLKAAGVRNYSVLVTGAGGSIGSELCRQILDIEPRLLVLYEQSEYALYEITRELENRGYQGKIVSILGNVLDRKHFEDVLSSYSVDTIFHAAAYKHVPLVEGNAIDGVRNNVMGTLHTAQAAIDCGVERFVLISTDKAVRPTNVMGASKRMAELVLQALAQEASTCFSMVRFGNVLGSSGSVVPLFRKQIEEGGPVTITHPEVTRYFMTIPEAVSLVLQAGSMAKGGEVFLLDMGEPVKIVDLARKMIRLSGFQVRDADHPEGDIEVEFVGLRPGEKLYEELLISEADESTAHPQIRKAYETSVPWSILASELHHLRLALDHRNERGVLRIMEAFVDGYEPALDEQEAKVA